LELIGKTISNYIKFIPHKNTLVRKHEIIDKIYFTIGKDSKKPEIQKLVKDVK